MPASRRSLSAPAWALRISVSLVFLLFGVEKLLGAGIWVSLFAGIGIGQWFRYFTGILQVAGAVFYAIPRTSLAGMALLACTMLGAAGVHLFVLHTGIFAALIPAILLGAILGVWRYGEARELEHVITIR
jgi:putative oxidoreductase